MDLTFYSSSCREARRERITSGRSSENVVLERAGAAIDSSPHVIHANGGWMSVGVVLQCCWTVNVSLVCCQTTQWCGLIGLLYKWNIAATIFEWIWGDPGLGGDYRIQIDNAFFYHVCTSVGRLLFRYDYLLLRVIVCVVEWKRGRRASHLPARCRTPQNWMIRLVNWRAERTRHRTWLSSVGP
jgi:hypothetical protein